MSDPGNGPTGPSQKPWRGTLWQLTAVLVGVGVPCIFVLAALVGQQDLSLTTQALIALPLCGAAAGAIVLVRALHRRGTRHRAPSGAERMERDERPPILYLRSFAEEASVLADEEALARVMSDIGPFVAIGRPGESLPPLGASRFYARHFERDGRGWQEFVGSLMSEAAFVFMVPGVTAGLSWELTECRKRMNASRLLILVPGRKAVYDDFRREIAGIAGLALPELPATVKDAFAPDEFAGLVSFGSNWQGFFHPFPKRPPRIVHVDHLDQREERLRIGLRRTLPVGQGEALRPTRRWKRYVIWSLWAAYLVLAIVLVVLWSA